MVNILATEEVCFSYNENIINKNERNDTLALAHGWKCVTGRIEDLISAIRSGIAYSAWFKDDHRSNKNFIGTNIISIDIDGTNTIDSVINHEFAQKHLTAFYTTCSHSDNEHRFRLIFKIQKFIDSPDEYRLLVRTLQLMFSGDSSATDPARIFFGNNNARTEIWPRQITLDAIDYLIKLNPSPNADSISHHHGTASSRSEIRLSPTKKITTHTGLTQSLIDIPDKTPVHCPFHHDENASAFVSVKESGFRFLHCARCKTTWHQENPFYEKRATIELDFVDTLKKIKAMSLEELENEIIKFPIILNGKKLHETNINFENSKYIEIKSISEGLTFIKSPKGSGKTESLKTIIQSLEKINSLKTESNLTYFIDEVSETENFKGKQKTNFKILLVGHRQALIRSMCIRLNLNCYLDESDKNINFNTRDFRAKYGICLDSIKKITAFDSPFHSYDLVIIDEVEQVLAHLLSATLSDSHGCLNSLEYIIQRAKYVIALDADLGWTSFLTLNSMRSFSEHADTQHRTEVFINEYRDTSKSFDLYNLKSELATEILIDLAADKKIFISTNSKRQVDRLVAAINEKIPTKKIISITSENSNTKSIIDFIKNIQVESKKYDVVISSPTLGTGIDISFPDNEDFFDTVYGIYESLVNSHTEIDQQLSRVRHPKSVKVWISPRIFYFETDFDVIKSDLLTCNVVANTALDFATPIAQQVFNNEHKLLRTSALIIAEQRHSKNNLKANFIKYKNSQGWTHVPIEPLLDKSPGTDFIRRGTELERLEFERKLLEAPPINNEQFIIIQNSIDDDIKITQGDYLSYQRMLLELFYCRKIDKEMITLDKRWKLRKQYALYKRFMLSGESTQWSQATKFLPLSFLKKKLTILRDIDSLPMLLKGILSLTPIYFNGIFNVKIEFTSTDLRDFSRYCIKLKEIFETQFEINLRSDVLTKPVAQLNDFLRLMGLSSTQSRTSRNGSQGKIYHYRLNEVPLAKMNQLLDMEAIRPHQWDEINARYKFL